MTGVRKFVHAWQRRNKRTVFGWAAYRCLACREYAFVRPKRDGTSWQAEATCSVGDES